MPALSVVSRAAKRQLLCSLLATLLTSHSASARADEPAPSDVGQQERPKVAHLLRVTAPIQHVDHYRRLIRRLVADAVENRSWPVIVLELDNGRSEFGQALDLARFLSGPELDGATTVAWLPKGATGHTVLVAVACDEIAMPPDAELGAAGAHEPAIAAELRSVYHQIAERRRTIPPDVVLGMLDPSLEVLQVETEVGRDYVLRERLPELEKQHAIGGTRVIIRAGEPGRFTGREAKELGFITYLADDTAALAREWRVPPTALEEDPALARDWKPIRVELNGPIDAGVVQQIERMIDKKIRESDANLIIISIDSAGGSPLDSIRLANYLGSLDHDKRRTVAYVPAAAQADAAFVALACDAIVVHPDAQLGGDWPSALPPAEGAHLGEALAEIARHDQRSPALAAAFANPQLEVFQYTNPVRDADEYWTVAEFDQRPDREGWVKGEAVTRAGEPLAVSGERAVTLGIARNAVRDFDEFKAIYGLENDPRIVEPTWVDRFVHLLNADAAGWVLLVIAAIGLYIEAHTPGLGVGGFVAGLCFLLFFWSHYLGGTADWLEILLFGAGALCILLEIFVLPGIGFFAFGGGALILVSVLLASQTFVLPHDDYQAAQMLRSLLVFSGIFAGFIVGTLFVRRLLPQTPGLGQMVLAPPSREETAELSRREALAMYDHLLGTSGTTVTPLTPAGKAKFGDEIVDVLAEGEFISPGSTVHVVDVLAHRVVVRAGAAAGSLG